MASQRIKVMISSRCNDLIRSEDGEWLKLTDLRLEVRSKVEDKTFGSTPLRRSSVGSTSTNRRCLAPATFGSSAWSMSGGATFWSSYTTAMQASPTRLAISASATPS